jgi:hypothetical protein
MSVDDAIEEALRNMTQAEKTLLADFTAGVDLAYNDYRKKHHLPDNPVTRMGFQMLIAHIIDDDPLPFPPLQKTVEQYLASSMAEITLEIVEEIQPIFEDAIRRSKS